ncbi:hypothetical protein C2E23DRAFT_387724 [Lenzites betulinus]|nr:hypothetical protein C2E23DRAFT_387724 [Lenzites betulinus]
MCSVLHWARCAERGEGTSGRASEGPSDARWRGAPCFWRGRGASSLPRSAGAMYGRAPSRRLRASDSGVSPCSSIRMRTHHRRLGQSFCGAEDDSGWEYLRRTSVESGVLQRAASPAEFPGKNERRARRQIEAHPKRAAVAHATLLLGWKLWKPGGRTASCCPARACAGFAVTGSVC